jgi:flavodoxin
MKKAVAYYSRTGNTKFVAEKIASQIGADLCEVLDKKNREGGLTYLTGGLAAYREKLTEIKVSKPIEEYDFVVVGSPIWAGKITPAIRKFLVANDFSSKLLAVFVTLGGDKPEKSLRNMKEAVKPKLLVGELAITRALDRQEETEKMVVDWCNQLQKSLK